MNVNEDIHRLSEINRGFTEELAGKALPNTTTGTIKSLHLLERALCYDYAWTMRKYFGPEEYEKIVKMVKGLKVNE